MLQQIEWRAEASAGKTHHEHNAIRAANSEAESTDGENKRRLWETMEPEFTPSNG